MVKAVGQKDIAEKILESYNDVFSDIVNVLLFNGRQILHEDELDNQSPRSAYKADGRYRYPVVTLVLYFGLKKRWDKHQGGL